MVALLGFLTIFFLLIALGFKDEIVETLYQMARIAGEYLRIPVDIFTQKVRKYTPFVSVAVLISVVMIAFGLSLTYAVDPENAVMAQWIARMLVFTGFIFILLAVKALKILAYAIVEVLLQVALLINRGWTDLVQTSIAIAQRLGIQVTNTWNPQGSILLVSDQAAKMQVENFFKPILIMIKYSCFMFTVAPSWYVAFWYGLLMVGLSVRADLSEAARKYLDYGLKAVGICLVAAMIFFNVYILAEYSPRLKSLIAVADKSVGGVVGWFVWAGVKIDSESSYYVVVTEDARVYNLVDDKLVETNDIAKAGTKLKVIDPERSKVIGDEKCVRVLFSDTDTKEFSKDDDKHTGYVSVNKLERVSPSWSWVLPFVGLMMLLMLVFYLVSRFAPGILNSVVTVAVIVAVLMLLYYFVPFGSVKSFFASSGKSLPVYQPSVQVNSDGSWTAVVPPVAEGVKLVTSDGQQFKLGPNDTLEIDVTGQVDIGRGVVGPSGESGYSDGSMDSPFKDKVGGLEMWVGNKSGKRHFVGDGLNKRLKEDGVPTFRVVESLNGYRDGNSGAFTVIIRKK